MSNLSSIKEILQLLDLFLRFSEVNFDLLKFLFLGSFLGKSVKVTLNLFSEGFLCTLWGFVLILWGFLLNFWFTFVVLGSFDLDFYLTFNVIRLFTPWDSIGGLRYVLNNLNGGGFDIVDIIRKFSWYSGGPGVVTVIKAKSWALIPGIISCRLRRGSPFLLNSLRIPVAVLGGTPGTCGAPWTPVAVSPGTPVPLPPSVAATPQSPRVSWAWWSPWASGTPGTPGFAITGGFKFDIIRLKKFIPPYLGPPSLGRRWWWPGSIPLSSLKDGEYRAMFLCTHDGFQHDSQIFDPTMLNFCARIFRASWLHQCSGGGHKHCDSLFMSFILENLVLIGLGHTWESKGFS